MIKRLKATVTTHMTPEQAFFTEFPEYRNGDYSVQLSRTSTLTNSLDRMYIKTGLAEHIATSTAYKDSKGQPVYMQVLKMKEF